MAYNTDTGWILKQAMFQNAIDGKEVKERLIELLDMLYKSHSLRVNNVAKDKVTTYEFRIANNVKDKWEIEIKAIIQFVSDGVIVPLERVYNVKYTDATKDSPFKLHDRFKLYHNGKYWNFKALVDPSSGASEWSSDHSLPIGTVISTPTFPAFPSNE